MTVTVFDLATDDMIGVLTEEQFQFLEDTSRPRMLMTTTTT
jgi:hypothetical protein